LDLFEKLERELKSIIELFNNERQQKRHELDALLSRVTDLEYQLHRQQDQATQE
jgi:t-SNARE complex subunit (syntaxin)